MVLCLGGWVNWLKVLFQTEGGQSLLLPSFSSSNSSYSSRPLPRPRSRPRLPPVCRRSSTADVWAGTIACDMRAQYHATRLIAFESYSEDREGRTWKPAAEVQVKVIVGSADVHPLPPLPPSQQRSCLDRKRRYAGPTHIGHTPHARAAVLRFAQGRRSGLRTTATHSPSSSLLTPRSCLPRGRRR